MQLNRLLNRSNPSPNRSEWPWSRHVVMELGMVVAVELDVAGDSLGRCLVTLALAVAVALVVTLAVAVAVWSSGR